MKDQLERKGNSEYFQNGPNPSTINIGNTPPDLESGLFLPSESHKLLSNLNNISTLKNVSNLKNLSNLNNIPAIKNTTQIPKLDLKNSTIPKINDIATINNMNINNLNNLTNLNSLTNITITGNYNGLDCQTSNKNTLIQNHFGFSNNQPKPEESETLLMENLNILLCELKRSKAAFKDKSRLFCCGCFSVCMIMVIIVFYIFDVMKYQETCNKTKKNYIEICDAPSIGFWPRFIFIAVSSFLLIFSLYCTGPTIILFDPITNKVFIDKKKVFCLPSVCEYRINDLLYAYIESDTTDGTPNLSNFSFYSVILVFKQDQINLGLGRDCFLINEKIQLVNKINRYLEAFRTIAGEDNFNYYGKEV